MSGTSRYQVLKHIASGGMAEVFLARDKSPSGIEKLVVLKRVLPQHNRNPEFLNMFRDEARIGAMLQHPNLVQMFEMGSHEGVPFISMEYLNGEDVRGLYKVLRERGQPLRLDVALLILSQVCAGLQYAHERVGLDGKPLNIVHRDISPQNVFVTYEGGVKVVDFGIARSENRLNQTQHAMMKGKIAYMAPEQVMSEPLDRRTDVYAVGVMLYEMTTGQRPFRRDNEVATMRAIVDDALTPPQKLVPGYPPELSAIVVKALARKREQRFQSAQELQVAIEGFARTRGFSLSSLMLTAYMRELFGARADAWREVLVGARPVESLPIEVRLDDEDVEPVSPDTSTNTIDVVAFPTLSQATFERVGPVSVVHLHGKLNEQFNGAELGRALAGLVVFDLANVERVTSFGVREWLQMLSVAEPKLAGLYFARCSEAVVNQLSMIKRFAGPAKVVSFLAPYLCRKCSHAFQACIDVEQHADALARQAMPSLSCPNCRAQADFDDDPRSYLAFGPLRPGELPPAVVTALAGLTTQQGPAIEKSIEGAVTRIRVRGVLDAALRWARVLDGVEGDVRLDLDEVTRFEPGGVQPLGTALCALGTDVTRLVLESAPRAVLEAARPALEQRRVVIGSVIVEGRCAACQASRSLRLEWPVSTAGSQTCKRCNGPMLLDDLEWLAGLVNAPVPAAPSAPTPVVALPGASPAPVVASPVAPAPSTVPRGRGLAAPVMVASLIVVAGLGWWTLRPAPPEQARAPSLPTAPTAPLARPVAERPLWATGPRVVEDAQGMMAWAHAGPVADAASAQSQAETAALSTLAEALLPLAPSEGFRRGLNTGTITAREVAAKLRQRLGAALELESQSGQTEAGLEAWVRLHLSAASLAAFKNEAAATATVRGATVTATPPQWPGAPGGGALYVDKVGAGSATLSAGLREGDLIVEAQGRPVGSVAQFEAIAREVEGKALMLRVQAQGLTRQLRVGP